MRVCLPIALMKCLPNLLQHIHLNSFVLHKKQRTNQYVYKSGADPVGAMAPPLKPAKKTFFTIILYNSGNNVRDIRPFFRRFFVTEVLWSIPHHSCHSEAVMKLDCQILLKSPPLSSLAVIRPCYKLLQSHKPQNTFMCYYINTVEW